VLHLCINHFVLEALVFADQYFGNFPFSLLLKTQLSEKIQ